jgi:hypothetical protein
MEDRPKGKVEDAIGAVERLVKAVPIYQDLVQPVAIETGQALKTVAKLVHIALAPVSVLIWSYDQLSHFLETKVASKLANVPEAEIKCPPADLAVPLLESVRLKGESAELIELYAQLLASAMQARDDRIPHPAFVEVLKQLSSDDARVLRTLYLKSATPYLLLAHAAGNDRITVVERCFTELHEESGTELRSRVIVALDNLERLGLIELLLRSELPDDSLYDDLEQSARTALKREVHHESSDQDQTRISRGTILLREFGTSFCRSCMEGEGGNRRISLKVVSVETASIIEGAYLVIVVPKIASMRRGGLTELISDIRMRVVGSTAAMDKITVTIFLNTNLTSRLVKDPWSEAAIFAGPQRVLVANGRQSGANSVVFTDIPLDSLNGLPIAQRYFTIGGVRCNANQLGAAGKGVEIFYEVNGIEVRSAASHFVGQMIDEMKVTAHCDALCSTSGPRRFSISELASDATSHRSHLFGQANLFVRVSRLFELEASDTGSLAESERVRLMLRFANIPCGVELFVGLTGLQDLNLTPLARLIETDSNGAGAVSLVEPTSAFDARSQTVPCSQLNITNGCTRAVYLLSLPPLRSMTVLIPIRVSFPHECSAATVELGSASVAVSLAPLSTVTTPSSSAPTPRFADTSKSFDLFQIER